MDIGYSYPIAVRIHGGERGKGDQAVADFCIGGGHAKVEYCCNMSECTCPNKKLPKAMRKAGTIDASGDCLGVICINDNSLT